MVTELDKGKTLPDYHDITAKLRESKHFKEYCDSIVKRGFGSKKWLEKASEKKISDFMKVGLEAFILLAYGNVYDACIKEHAENKNKPKEQVSQGNPKGEEPKKKRRETKYTNDSKASSRNSGWSIEGIKMYQHFRGLIKVDRVKNQAFDEMYLAQMQEAKKVRKNGGSEAVPEVILEDDFGDEITDFAEI